MMAWDRVTRGHVLRAIQEYDRLGPKIRRPEEATTSQVVLTLAIAENLAANRLCMTYKE
jgi:hypothetical protein